MHETQLAHQPSSRRTRTSIRSQRLLTASTWRLSRSQKGKFWDTRVSVHATENWDRQSQTWLNFSKWSRQPRHSLERLRRVHSQQCLGKSWRDRIRSSTSLLKGEHRVLLSLTWATSLKERSHTSLWQMRSMHRACLESKNLPPRDSWTWTQ